jgi:hypothetical protein
VGYTRQLFADGGKKEFAMPAGRAQNESEVQWDFAMKRFVKLLLDGLALGSCGSGKDRALGVRLLGHQDGKAYRSDHEDYSAPGCSAGEQVGRGAGSKGGLRALAAEGSGEIGALALLEKNDGDHEETNDYVDNDKQINHAVAFLSGILDKLRDIWCGRGDLNPHASRRHPLKMVCLPFHHFRTFVSGCPSKV